MLVGLGLKLIEVQYSVFLQITGPSHSQAYQVVEHMTNVLLNASDVTASKHMVSRSLSLAAQLQGLDCHDTIGQNINLGMLYSELSDNHKAFDYLRTAKYLIQIVGGYNHPEQCNLLLRMSMMYERTGDIESALHCLILAKKQAKDLMRSTLISTSIASFCFRHGRVVEAVQLQKLAYKTMKDLAQGQEDERVLDVKKDLESYIRAQNQTLENGKPAPTKLDRVPVLELLGGMNNLEQLSSMMFGAPKYGGVLLTSSVFSGNDQSGAVPETENDEDSDGGEAEGDHTEIKKKKGKKSSHHKKNKGKK